MPYPFGCGLVIQVVNEAAFTELFRAHRDAVYRYARLFTRSAEGAEDVAQEAFLALARGGYDPMRGPVRAWLFGTARRQALKRFRSVARECELDDQPYTPATVESAGVRDAVFRAVESLPAAQREAVLLFHWEGFSLEEIASLAGTEVGTVKSRLHRARESLRHTLAPYHSTEGAGKHGTSS